MDKDHTTGLNGTKILNNNLELLLKEWSFPINIIEKYKALKITEIFDWQVECLQIDQVLSNYFVLIFIHFKS